MFLYILLRASIFLIFIYLLLCVNEKKNKIINITGTRAPEFNLTLLCELLCISRESIATRKKKNSLLEPIAEHAT